MRLGIDARLNAYREGGIAEYTRRLIESLAELDRASEYRILHRVASPTTLAPASNFRRVDVLSPCHHRFERLTLAAEVTRLRLDLLHSPDFIPPAFVARHTVITVHDLNFLHYPQFQTADSLRYYAGNIQQAVRQADHILADSQATKDDLGNLLNVPEEKITVHLLGVNPTYRPLPSEGVEETQERLGLPTTYLLFVGTFEPRKNLAGLLDAYRVLCERMPDSPPLVIVGRRGWLYESIFHKVADLKLEQRVFWLEDVPFADLPAVYNGAVALVLPSFYEGFGFPPLEAMACGVPTVVSNRGSLPEVVGEVGIVIDPDRKESLVDGLCRILTDSDLRARSREAGLARARTFTWERTARIALSVYQRVIDREW